MSEKTKEQSLVDYASDFGGGDTRPSWGIIKLRQKFIESPDGNLMPGRYYQVPPKSETVSDDEGIEGQSSRLFEESDHVDCFVLATKNPKVLWEVGKSDGPVCFSINGEYPDARDPVSPSCRTCPLARTECKPGADLLVLVPTVDDGKLVELRPYMLQLGKAGLRSTRKFTQRVLLDHVQNKLGYPPFQMKTRIKAELCPDSTFKFYIPVFPSVDYYDKQVAAIKQGKGLTEEQIADIKELRDELVPIFKQENLYTKTTAIAVATPAGIADMDGYADARTASQPTDVIDIFAEE